MEVILKDLNENQKNIYLGFLEIIRNQDKIPEAIISNSSALRFLMSVDFKVNEALQSVRKSYEWRLKMNWAEIENFDQNLVQLMVECVKIGFYGEDFEGRPIKIVRPLDFDIDLALQKIPQEKSFHFQMGNTERMVNIVFPMLTNRYQRHIYNQVVIVDIKHINFGKLLANPKMMDLGKARSSIFQDNYPEITHKTVIVNAGTMFYAFWKIVSIFLKKKTLDKISIFNENYLPELLKITTIEKIPSCLGGLCPCEIDNYTNFYDAEWERSIQERRLRLK